MEGLMEIQIRHAEPDDYLAIHTIYTQPTVVWGTLQLPYVSAEKRRQRLLEPREGAYSLVACVDGNVVGQLSLHTFPQSPRRRHVGGLGMGVHDDWQGKGVGTALIEAVVALADQWLNLTRLELQVYTDNEPAVWLYKKLGFEVEGTLRRFAFRDGQMADVYAMARLI
jgi:L-phenylalanine/L-methionine N-acetyltransferase